MYHARIVNLSRLGLSRFIFKSMRMHVLCAFSVILLIYACVVRACVCVDDGQMVSVGIFRHACMCVLVTVGLCMHVSVCACMCVDRWLVDHSRVWMKMKADSTFFICI